MNVLITGSEGFLASYLRTELEIIGWKWFGYDIKYSDQNPNCLYDICDPNRVRLQAEGCDIIFNLAGEIRVPPSFEDPMRYWRNNTLGAATVFSVARKLNIPVVHASTSAASFPESSPYAASKKAAEMAAVIENNLGADIRVARIFNVYGPGQPDDFVIPLFINSKEIILHNNGIVKKDYIHVRDVVRGLIAVAKDSRDFFKLGSGKLTSAAEIAELCNTYRKDKPTISSVENIQRLKDHQGEIATRELYPHRWEPQISIEDGILELVRGYERKRSTVYTV